MPFSAINKAGKRRAFAVLSVLVLLLAMAGCRRDSPLGKGFRFPLNAEPRQLDPQVSTDTASITVIMALFEGLTQLDKEGRAIPAAADWVVSEDGKTYTFSLRENVWNNGEPVTADDFVFGMQRAVSPSTRSSLAAQLFGIENARAINAGSQAVETLGVQVVDSRTLVIRLTEADDRFPEKLASTPFMPCNRAFFEQTNGQYGLEKKFVLTNGAFFVDSWAHGDSLRLEKHTGYHDADNVYPAAVRYRISSPKTGLDALISGDLDATLLSADQLEPAKAAGVQLVPLSDTIQYLWMNNTQAALSTPALRRALRDSVEWERLYAQLDSLHSAPAKGFVPPASVLSGGEKYRNESNARVPVSKGREMLTALNAALREAGLTEMPQLTLLCPEDSYHQNLAQFIVQSWQKNLSVYFRIETLPQEELDARVQAGNYELAIASCTPPDTTALEALMMFSDRALTANPAGYASKTYNALAADAAGGTHTRAQLDAMEEQLWQDCPAVPLSFQTRYYGVTPGVSGLYIRAFNGGAFGAPIDFRHAGKEED